MHVTACTSFSIVTSTEGMPIAATSKPSTISSVTAVRKSIRAAVKPPHLATLSSRTVQAPQSFRYYFWLKELGEECTHNKTGKSGESRLLQSPQPRSGPEQFRASQI
jgi:hypothetical protein